MLISDSHQFIFLRMRKVASTSMKSILLPYCIPKPQGKWAHISSRARLQWNYHNYVPRAHDQVSTIQRRMPVDTFDQYFKFAFVRNPWERLVSEYEFLLRKVEHGRHARVKRLKNFNAFIHMQIPRRDAYQFLMVCNRKGNLLADFIGKLENLENDWKTVCERIDIPYQALPHKNTSTRGNFRKYYDAESRKLVANHWSREIALFDYNFDEI